MFTHRGHVSKLPILTSPGFYDNITNPSKALCGAGGGVVEAHAGAGVFLGAMLSDS